MTEDPRERAERVLRGGVIFVGVLFVVGLVAFLASNPWQTVTIEQASNAPKTDFKAQVRASNQADREARAVASWGRAVEGVCNNGKVAFPAIKYGFDARNVDTVAAVNAMNNGVRAVRLPEYPNSIAQVQPLLDEGNRVTALWNALGKRTPKDIPDLEKAAAVDRARAWVQSLIDKGAEDCQELLPAPNPPIAPPPLPEAPADAAVEPAPEASPTDSAALPTP